MQLDLFKNHRSVLEEQNRIVISVLTKLCQVSERFVADAMKMVEEKRAYKVFVKKNRNGKKRIIFAPNEILKMVQKQLLLVLYRHFSVADCFFGGQPGKSNVKNALAHTWQTTSGSLRTKTIFLFLDLKKAFPSVRTEVVRKVLYKNEGLKEEICGIVRELKIGWPTEEVYRSVMEEIISLIMYKDRMPQGVPTSSYLMNVLIFESGLISRIKDLCSHRGMRFSIYTDDFIFSFNRRKIKNVEMFCQSFAEQLTRVIEQAGFFVNPEKIKTFHIKSTAPKITGVVLAKTKEGVAFTTVRQRDQNKYRRKIFWATRFLRENGRLPIKDVDDLSLQKIRGIISWVESATRGEIPSRLKGPIREFKEELKSIRRRNSKAWQNLKLVEKITGNS